MHQMMFRLTVSATREKYLKLRYQYFYLTSADTDTGRYFDGIPTHNYQTTGIRYLSLALCSHKTRRRPVLARDLDLSQYNFAAVTARCDEGYLAARCRWFRLGGAVPLKLKYLNFRGSTTGRRLVGEDNISLHRSV